MLIGDERTAESLRRPGGRDSSASTTASASSTASRWGWWARAPPGTGTVIRPATVQRYAEEAGFSSCEVLPIENDFWRFYLLRP